MNEVLKTKSQIFEASKWLKENNYITHPISCKDFELKNVIERISDGDILDLGADGSFVLHNAILKDIKGRKVGIDLAEVTGSNIAEGAEYFQGDIMATPFEDNSFNTLVCLSVVEHEVDINKLASECSRLLRRDGKLFLSCDYWENKIDTEGKLLYKLKWNILDRYEAFTMVSSFLSKGFALTSEIDWTSQDAVITPQYCSPANVSYTFLLLEFIKK